jgi:hypothetical protein
MLYILETIKDLSVLWANGHLVLIRDLQRRSYPRFAAPVLSMICSAGLQTGCNVDLPVHVESPTNQRYAEAIAQFKQA